MLPSRGYFKKNDCPFFEKGLCKRPSCHFRHRKKVVSDEPETRKILQPKDPVTLQSTSSIPLSDPTPSKDSLFARLVNQPNTYEKISRHIPCAYTPTPKTRSLQAKKPSNTNLTLEQSKAANALLQKTNYVNNSEISVNENKNHEKYLNNHENTEFKTSYLQNSHTELKDTSSIVETGTGTKYVPTKGTSAETKYVPNSSGDADSSKVYVPSKEKSKQCQYVPESTSSLNDIASYTPSGKTSSGETMYKPDAVEGLADYVPTEKSATVSTIPNYVPTEKSATNSVGDTWLEVEDPKSDLAEFEFISSEIEMMKELLKEDIDEQVLEMKEQNKKKEEVPNSQKVHKTSSTSKHKSESNHRRSSSSRSKHKSSRSSSSKHSSRSSSSKHHSSSSRHTSSSKGKSSSHDKDRKRSRDSSKDKSSDRNKKHKNDRSEEKKKLEDMFSGSDNDCDVALSGLSDIDDAAFDEADDDPDTVERQCLEIFNNYSGTSGSSTTTEITVSAGDFENSVQSKKRTAHATNMTSDHSVLREKTTKKVHVVKSAQEILYERYKTAEVQPEATGQSQPMRVPLLGLNRPPVRIAAVQNIQQMLQAKKAIQERIRSGQKINERTTIAHTVTHGSSRVAHLPAVKELKEKPTVKDGTRQVPRIKRQTYLDKLLAETNQIFPTRTEAAAEALKLEEEVFRANSGSLPGYSTAFFSLLMKTKRRVALVKGEVSGVPSNKGKISHSDVLSGGRKNFSVLKTRKVEMSMLSDRHIYEELLRCKLTPEELRENSFPMESDRPGFATCELNFELKYNKKYTHIKKMSGNKRYCVRCSKQYEVDPNTWKQYKEGPETCCYHPGKKKSDGRHADRVYSCCNSASSEGCSTHVRHVTDCNDYENLPHCVQTFAKPGDDNPGVYALDCEMVYTRLGYELARITVVNLKKEIVYDTLVKPRYPVECYNSIYSGIEEKMMESVETTIKDVQAVLLSLFSNKTIIIGHSLDSDLRALHLIHETVVDTSVVYKNEKYHPYKYSLKDLSAKKISKIIQDNVGGHDSSEDAIAALEIMLHYIKEEVGKYESLESYEADRLR